MQGEFSGISPVQDLKIQRKSAKDDITNGVSFSHFTEILTELESEFRIAKCLFPMRVSPESL